MIKAQERKRTKMEDAKYEVGDVVLLKSGGMLMTVTAVGGQGVTCAWHTCGGYLRTGQFTPETIRKAKEEKPRARSPEELLKELGRDPVVLAGILAQTISDESRWAERAEKLGRLSREKGVSATVVHDILTSR